MSKTYWWERVLILVSWLMLLVALVESIFFVFTLNWQFFWGTVCSAVGAILMIVATEVIAGSVEALKEMKRMRADEDER